MVSIHTETLPRHIKELVVLSEVYKHILYGGEHVRPRKNHEWDDSGFEDDHIARMPMWKSYLYHLQTQAPKPKRIVCQREVPNRPPYYGREFHSAISREDTDFLLTIGGEGSYLIRESQRAPGMYTLAIRFDGVTKNFKLYYDGQHYVGEKRFDAIQDLVADGLITFYLESKASDYIADLSNQSNYAESPYVAYNTYKKKQLAAPRTGSRLSKSGASGSLSSTSGSHRNEASANERTTRGDVTDSGQRQRVAPLDGEVAQRDQRGGQGAKSRGVAPRSERPEQSGSAAAPNDPNKGNRKSAANLPIDSRISQIIDHRQEGAQTVIIKKESVVSSSQGQNVKSTVAASSTTVMSGATAAVNNQLADLSQHEYANQIQINLHRQRQQEELANQRRASPKASPNQRQGEVASRQSHDDMDSDRRVTSSTNTDGPPTVSSSSSNSVNSVLSASQISQNGTTTANSINSSLPQQQAPAVKKQMSSSVHSDVPMMRPISSPANNGVPLLPIKKSKQKRQSHEVVSMINDVTSLNIMSSSVAGVPNMSKFSKSQRTPPRNRMLEEPHFGGTPPGSPQMFHDDSKFSNVAWCADYLQVLGSEKTHQFKSFTFKGPHWCDFCANFLWGLIQQGVKCQDCGFNAHKKCSEKVPNDCMPDMKYVKRMFCVDLTTLVKAHNTLIPVVVEKCVKEIEKRGIEAEGIYRVAGFHDDVEAIKMSFDKDGELTEIGEDKYDDINTITSLLKLYFRLLPIPLITFNIYFQVIDLVREYHAGREDLSHDQMLELLRREFLDLPPAHYHTLKYLMAHLHRVTEKQSRNMMSAENLAIVFAPTLLRSPETDPLSGLNAATYERELIELLIEHQVRLLDRT